MKQPIRKIDKKIKKKPIKKDVFENKSNKKASKNIVKKKTLFNDAEQRYGTSKLEKKFAQDFLDKYGIKYIYEYEAKDIKRFYDFAIVRQKERYITEEKEGLCSVVQGCQHCPIEVLIEVDGGYWHSDPRIVDESKLNATQKHNKMVDNLKNEWARIHCIPLLRFWEYDIQNNPQKVFAELKKYIHINDSPKKSKKRVVNYPQTKDLWACK